VLIFFLVSFRAAVIVALTIPLSLLFAFILLHGRGVPANLLSIGAIDFGIIIDGTVVMMENIYRELAERYGQDYKLSEVILAAARDVDRPIFYSVAGHPGRIPSHLRPHRPLGETVRSDGGDDVLRSVGIAHFHSHTCAYSRLVWFKNGVKEIVNKPYEWVKGVYAGELDWCLDHPKTTMVVATLIFAVTLLLIPYIGGDSCRTWTKAHCGCAPRCRTRFLSRKRRSSRRNPQHPDVLSAGDASRIGIGPPGRWHRSHWIFQLRILVGLRPYKDKVWEQGAIRNKSGTHRGPANEPRCLSRRDFQLHAASRGRRGRALTGLKSALAVKSMGRITGPGKQGCRD